MGCCFSDPELFKQTFHNIVFSIYLVPTDPGAQPAELPSRELPAHGRNRELPHRVPGTQPPAVPLQHGQIAAYAFWNR
jgi:hypothetical protein